MIQFMINILGAILADNWAFLYAQKLALNLEMPLHVCFCLVPHFLEATIRHYGFMLKGLQEVQRVRIINFVLNNSRTK